MVTIPTPRRVQEGCVTHGARGCGNHRVSGELLGCGHQVQRQKGGCWGRGLGRGGSGSLLGTECPLGRMDGFLETDGDLGSSA